MRRLLLLTALTMLAACSGPNPRGRGDTTAPPDFALVFTVLPNETAAPAAADDDEAPAVADPMARPTQHILTPDRVLRVAHGPGVHPGLYPPATATLSPAQVDRLWAIVREFDLTRPRADVEGTPACAIGITAFGTRTRYVTTPAVNPGAEALLRALVELRGEPPATPHAP